MKKRVWMLLLISLIACCVCVGCKKKEQATTEQKESLEKEVETETAIANLELVTETEEMEENHEGQSKSYLTGEWVDQEIAKQRPIALMVENTKMALPQYGLGKADIIYECPVEGGISRLMAIYQDYSGMEKVGNVRSCRHYYAYFAKEFDAMYFHAGASSIAYKGVLAANFIEDVDGITGTDGKYFFRASGKKAPHNLYTSSDQIEKAVKEKGFRTVYEEDYQGHYTFAEDGETITLENGKDATKVSMYYQNAKPWFEYNKKDGLYYRFEFGSSQKDGLTDKQLAVKNVIVQYCNSKVVDNVGRLDITHVGSGKGLYITNGKCIDITWKRDSDYDRTHYYNESGQEIVLNQGKTWVEIAQNNYAEQNIISGE